MDSTEVIFRREGALGRITLSRPKALNALTRAMVAAILAQLQEWARDPEILTVVIDALPGRAFCAGGDVRAIYESAKQRNGSAAAFFTTEYRMNSAIKHFPKPYVALIDGIAFGGGVGVSVHGSHRVVSENTLLGMPETGIGLFPDVGGTYVLPRLPGQLGMYLALTGARLKADDLLYTGLATHVVPASRHAEIRERLAQGETPEAALATLGADPGPAPVAAYRGAIDRAFAAPSVQAILKDLPQEGDWGARTAAHLVGLSPTSLEVTFRAVRAGRALDFDSCMRMEYRLATRLVQGHDFSEGVRAAVIDKDQMPRWRPASLGEVRDADIARYFEPLGAEELTL